MDRVSLRASRALAVLFGATLCAGIPGANGAVLVYEGFSGYTNEANINGVAANANTVGLQGTYNGIGSNSTFKTVDAGLTFGGLVTSGGALQTVTVANPGTFSRAGVQLNATATGTLYTSYLVQYSGALPANWANTALNTAANGGSGSSYFRTQADTSATGALIGSGYDSGATAGSTSLALDTTYLMIGRYTNVGAALSAGSPGVGTTYALSLAQFNNWVSAGQTEAWLDGAAVGVGAAEITGRVSDAPVTSGTYLFDATRFVQILNVSDQANSGTYDEIRFATTLGEVAPVPEPAAIALLGISSVALMARRRRA